LVLRYGGKALVQEVFQTDMVNPHQESPVLEIRPPMPDDVNKAHELTLVCGETSMARSRLLAKKAIAPSP
jgi:hypothetical protein